MALTVEELADPGAFSEALKQDRLQGEAAPQCFGTHAVPAPARTVLLRARALALSCIASIAHDELMFSSWTSSLATHMPFSH